MTEIETLTSFSTVVDGMNTMSLLQQPEDVDNSDYDDDSYDSDDDSDDEECTEDSAFDSDSNDGEEEAAEQPFALKMMPAYQPSGMRHCMSCPNLAEAAVTKNVQGLVALAGVAQKQQGSTAQAEEFVLQQLLHRRFQSTNFLNEPSIIQTTLPTQTLSKPIAANDGSKSVENKQSQGDALNPKDLLIERMQKVLGAAEVKPVSYKDVPTGFFDGTTQADILAYDKEITDAVRDDDFEKVKECYYKNKGSNPRILQCSNKFGESLVHLAARRGCTEIMKFMIHQASVSVKLICDSGRTPLHDACWTQRPNFDVVRELTTFCPDLWLVQDKRGFVPLQYVPRDCWAQWCAFLESADETLLSPKELL